LENGQLLCLLGQLAFKPGIFSSQFAFAFRRRQLLLLFAAPGIELRFIQTEFAGSSSDAYAFSKFKGFLAEFGCVLLTWLFTGWY